MPKTSIPSHGIGVFGIEKLQGKAASLMDVAAELSPTDPPNLPHHHSAFQ
ncbi:hypothetical protein LOZ80_26530 [Paenibacillus sp. HWE-109]|nr:hypothetical protein [Paenibacillus sp. HWE-109]UKS25133.1 hypothetical protein LOZ80_26530 [Paenibacillus sp. HWE-109]